MNLGLTISNLNLQTEEGRQALGQLLQNASPGFSFWGTRIIRVVGYEETIAIDTLANKILDSIDSAEKMISRRSESSAEPIIDKILKRSLQRRAMYQDVLPQMRRIYTESDKQSADGITAFFVFLRSLPRFFFPCFYWSVLSPQTQIEMNC